MSLEDVWTARALEDLRALPDWRIAEQVAKAVRRYATEGVGSVLHIRAEDGPSESRLLIPKTRTYVLVRRAETTLHVERVVYRA